VGELPEAPSLRWGFRGLLGPGLMMAGSAIGGGEWLMGPAVTAQYGGVVMWLAMTSIVLQVTYNLSVMRYTIFCGEPIIIGWMRLMPGPRVWVWLYLILDFFAIWPYLSANAAVPLNAALLGHLPAALPTTYLSVDEVAARTGLATDVLQEIKDNPKQFALEPKPGTDQQRPPEPIAQWMERERTRSRWFAYGIFLCAFVPLIFGGKVYNSLERIMTAKIILVLSYLIFVGLFLVSWQTWAEVFAGFVFIGKGSDGSWGFRLLPDLPEGVKLDWALLAAFAAIAGNGGLTNSSFSNYVRDKGWGMGSLVGAIPSMFGGKQITLSHTGRVFHISDVSLARWKGWMRVLSRDQWVIWGVGCVLGMAIPSLVSLEFVRGQTVQGDAVAAATAQGIMHATAERGMPPVVSQTFWFLTLFCGFIVLAPSQISTIDGIMRRWTDVLWTGNPRLRELEGHKVKYVYYTLNAAYAVFGLIVLVLLGSKLMVIVKGSTWLMNFGLGLSALHTLVVNVVYLPRELRPGWALRISLVACAVFFIGISLMGLGQVLRDFGLIK
jgi:Mn2+/Fe2+ NRAMP family transporter